MALNIAVPLSGLGGLSPISPIGIDCWENIKILVSPIGSESSGVSSLDSEEAKQQVRPIPPRKPEAIKQELQINYNGRNVLDLYNNLETNSTSWKFQYSHLPENNISMFWANRSLYNRLGPNGLTPVYTINKCECCDFQYTSDCPTSYLSETSLNMSSTTTSPMIFTTASNTKQDYHTTKVTTVSAQLTSNVAAAINNQQSFTGYKSSLELPNKQFCNQNNVNKAKLNDIFLKKSNLTNSNNNYNTIYKFNNLIGSTKNATEVSQLASALIAANISNSPPNTPSNNMMMGYSNNTMHHNGCNEQMTNNSKCNVPQNFFNSSLTLTNTTNPVAANHNFHGNTNHVNTNNVLLNHNNCNNKPQISTSNNFYSLFNSNNTNNSAMYSLNANVNANGNGNGNGNSNNNNNNNSYINSFNTISNNSNNINSNPLTVNSQHYGRMYKYF